RPVGIEGNRLKFANPERFRRASTRKLPNCLPQVVERDALADHRIGAGLQSLWRVMRIIRQHHDLQSRPEVLPQSPYRSQAALVRGAETLLQRGVERQLQVDQ